MDYSITKRVTLNNQSSYDLVNPCGVEIHSTADLGATAQNENNYFNNNYVGANAHAFIDFQDIMQDVETYKQAWGAGPTANSKYLMIELCEFDDASKFAETWKRGVWLTAYWLKNVCKTTIVNAQTVPSHKDTSDWWKETDHQDPIVYFAKHNKTMLDFRNDVAALLGGVQAPLPTSISYVTTFQKAMNSMGIRGENGLVLDADGVQGTQTNHALKDFQVMMGIPVTSIIDSLTLQAITQIMSRPIDSVPAPHYEYATRFICWKTGCPITGTYNDKVKQFVIAWQTKNKLSADGVVGTNSWNKFLN